MKIARFTLVLLATFALAFPALSAPARRVNTEKEPLAARGGGSFTPSRHTPARPNRGLAKDAGQYSFWCYADPNTTWGCEGTSGYCHSRCEETCGGECTWRDAQI
jgi:hypothetical protein